MTSVHPIILLLAALGFGTLWVLSLFALFVIVTLFKAKRLPMDQSNRINHIRLFWFALTRPEVFADSFEWLKHDELDNIKNNKG